MLRFLARLALVVAGCAMLAGPCFAHATLLGSEPAEGSVVATPPAKMRLSFNEPVTPLVFKLFDPDGRSADVTATAQDNDLLVELPAAGGEGTYALSWRVTSADGHPIGGTATFSIGHASHRAAAETARTSATAPLIWLTRIGVYIGWIGGVGGAFFLMAVAAGRRPAVADRAIAALLGLGGVATLFSFGLQGLDELGGNLASLGRAAPWLAGLQSPYGGTLCLGVVALVLAALALRLPAGKVAAGTASAALVAVAFALTLSGHASTAAPAWAARPALALHGAAAALWGGSLLPLLLLVVTRHEGAGRSALRLSALLLPTVAVLALSGLTLAILQGVTVATLTGTDYGRLLAGKLLLVLAMLGIGALNRRILVPRLAIGGDGHFRHLRQVLMVDVCLLLLVLAVVAGWRFTPPPRSIAAAEAALRHRSMLHIHTARGMAMIEIGGQGDLDIRLSGADGRPLAAQEVRVSLANPAAGVEPLQRQATLVANGHWRVDGLIFPVGGAWTLRLGVLVSDFDSLSLEGTLTVP
ncbi:Copper resistance protein C [uncultured Pleomorphomonas sp.]|uniref:Copper resistance protein C n=1 Tax=uncultured Pleomorphomonas sp. TaxID=442121 RepID=A0A212KZD2_9HYPH|nr:copper resistance protein CopC [uncultured Pleomorphomonas sp.]SCM70684.1 Copper resistance protein C [uncultured Pleomorphomonas sp.]